VIALIGFGLDLIVSGIQKHQAASIIGGAFMAAVGAIAPVLVLTRVLETGLRRAIPGAEPPAIEVALDRTRYAAGDDVTGHVKVTRAGHCRKLDVTLRCRDRTADYEGTSRTGTSAALATGELRAPAEHPFTLTLPAGAPISYADRPVEIWWEIGARCDLLGSDVHVATRIEVAVGDRVAA